MTTPVILPALGMSQDTGQIVQWLKAEGTQVTKGEALVEIETDKATVEIEAPADGILAHISATVGDEVPVGQVIADILPPDESSHSIEKIGSQQKTTPRLIKASPKARRLANEQDKDLATITGSGPEGAILAADILPTQAQTHEASDLPLSSIWRIMAERTTQSWTQVPHFQLMREVNASRFITWRQLVLKQTSISITYTDLLVKVVAAALRLHHQLNVSWNKGKLIQRHEIHIGLAVAIETGLVVPVIHQADTLSLQEIARARSELVTRAQSGNLRPQDIHDGTFTISNLGMYGVDAFSAIINQPQAAILAIGRIAERVVPVHGQPAVQPTMILTLSCDHRAVDGARGAQFLTTLAELIQEPLGLLY